MSEPTYRKYQSPLEARLFRVYPQKDVNEDEHPVAVIDVRFLDLLMSLAGYDLVEGFE